jgi:hypothetical protein
MELGWWAAQPINEGWAAADLKKQALVINK